MTATDNATPPPSDRKETGRRMADYKVYRLFTCPDAMHAWVRVEADKGADVSLEDLYSFLVETEVTFGIDEEALKKLAFGEVEEKTYGEELIATGQEPVPGVDGHIDYVKTPAGHREISKEQQESKSNIDYKEIHSFENVREGDLIGTYIPPQEGTGGSDVFGRASPPKDVKDIELTAGEGVMYDPVKKEYTAAAHGYVELDGNTLKVNSLYSVRDSVNLSEGNIRFIGRVDVRHDILDDFEVTAAEGLSVGGTIEAAQISSGTDIVVRGGVVGKERGKIQAKGNIFARFLNDVTVIAGGDIVVAKEIVNTKVFALGRVLVPKGAIVGSEVVALRGVVVRDVGSELGVKTQVAAGLDYHVADQLFDMHRNLEKLIARQADLLNKLGPKLERALAAAALDNSKREALIEEWREVHGMQRRIEKLEKESGEISSTFDDKAVARVEITGDIFPGTSVVVGKFTHVFEDNVRGPIALDPNEERRCATIHHVSKDKSVLLATPVPAPAWEHAENESEETS